jgi:hypothetical protein
MPPKVSPPEPVFGVASQGTPLTSKSRHHSRSNVITVNLSVADIDSSDSEAIPTDSEREHMSLNELAKVTQHVQRMLARITLILKRAEGAQNSTLS